MFLKSMVIGLLAFVPTVTLGLSSGPSELTDSQAGEIKGGAFGACYFMGDLCLQGPRRKHPPL